MEKIVARCRVMQEPTFQREEPDFDRVSKEYPHIWFHIMTADPILYELQAPERERRYGEMKNAIDRVCEVIDAQRKRPTHQG